MGFAAVARVTEDRWVACAVRDEIAFGLKPGGELKVETTICNEIRQSGTEVVIDHVAEDNVFCGHPTPRMYGFQSYISVPITVPGRGFFGTLCSIDPRPARVDTPAVRGMFRLFAELIAFHLDVQDRLTASAATLSDERRTAELREQFIAVLGHDLGQVVAESQAARPDRPVEAAFVLVRPIDCDRHRIAQLASNLIANAQTYGNATAPIRVTARSEATGFELSVSNAGEPIPAGALARLFKPFERGAVEPGQQGLGLGLYISSEIARAHGGTLEATSNAEETRFTFRLPSVSS